MKYMLSLFSQKMDDIYLNARMDVFLMNVNMTLIMTVQMLISKNVTVKTVLTKNAVIHVLRKQEHEKKYPGNP